MLLTRMVQLVVESRRLDPGHAATDFDWLDGTEEARRHFRRHFQGASLEDSPRAFLERARALDKIFTAVHPVVAVRGERAAVGFDLNTSNILVLLSSHRAFFPQYPAARKAVHARVLFSARDALLDSELECAWLEDMDGGLCMASADSPFAVFGRDPGSSMLQSRQEAFGNSLRNFVHWHLYICPCLAVLSAVNEQERDRHRNH